MKKINIGDTVINGLPIQQHIEMKDYDEYSIETKEQVEEMKKIQQVKKVINIYEKEGTEYVVLSDGGDIQTITRQEFEDSDFIRMEIKGIAILKTSFHIANLDEIVLWELKIKDDENTYKSFCFGTTDGYEGLQDGAYALLGFNLPGYQQLISGEATIQSKANYEIDIARYIYIPKTEEPEQGKTGEKTEEKKKAVIVRKTGKFKNRLAGLFKG